MENLGSIIKNWAGKLAQRLRALVAKDTGSIPNTHMVSSLSPQEPDPHVVYRDANRKNTHIH